MAIVRVHITEGKKMNVKPSVGVDICLLMDGEEPDANTYLTSVVTTLKPGFQLRPVHSHKDIEEITYVVEGKGQFWIDGETCEISKGDLILEPANSKHTVKNVGGDSLVLLCFFSSPNYRKKGCYITYKDMKVSL